MPDLNDARVEAYTIARDAGMDVETFNRIWGVIVPAARQHPTEDAFGITHGVTVEQAVGLAASLVQTLNEAVPTIRRLESVIEQKAIEEK